MAGVSSRDGEHLGLGPQETQACPGETEIPPGELRDAKAEAALPHRCTRRTECPRAEEASHWLWSRDKSCVEITDTQPQNMSRREQKEVHGGLSWDGVRGGQG